MLIARSVVKSSGGGTPAPAAGGASVVSSSLSYVRARGATISAGTRSPTCRSTRWGERSAPRTAVIATIRATEATTRRPASRRVRRTASDPRCASMSALPGSRGAGGATVGAAARARREPAHHLAHVARGGRAGFGERLPHEEGQLGLGQGLREELGQDRDLGRLLRGGLGAASLLEGLDALAPGLDLLGYDHRDLVIRVRAPVALLRVVYRAHGHAERA